jgi:hypothetical protein
MPRIGDFDGLIDHRTSSPNTRSAYLAAPLLFMSFCLDVAMAWMKFVCQGVARLDEQQEWERHEHARQLLGDSTRGSQFHSKNACWTSRAQSTLDLGHEIGVGIAWLEHSAMHFSDIWERRDGWTLELRTELN